MNIGISGRNNMNTKRDFFSSLITFFNFFFFYFSTLLDLLSKEPWAAAKKALS